MQKSFRNSKLITKSSKYNFEAHKPDLITERIPLEAKSLVLETNHLKLALGNLFESIIVFYSKLNSTDETFEQVAILEANYPYPLRKKTNLDKIYDSDVDKIKGGIRCDIFKYSEKYKEAQISEVKWGKSKSTIQSGFDTYPIRLLQRFQARHKFEHVKQYTIGIMPFQTKDFQTHNMQEYICFPLELCHQISRNPEQTEILTSMVSFLLNPESDLQQNHWLEFQTVINLIANQSQINDYQTATNLAIDSSKRIQQLLKGNSLENSTIRFKNNIAQKIHCLLLSFVCKLSRIEDEKSIPGSNLEILQEVEFLTEIINNLSEYTNDNLANQDLSQIYQILFIAIKKFKINFESLYFENTNYQEDYYTQDEEIELKDSLKLHDEFTDLITESLKWQNLILIEKIISLNFKYTNYYIINFLEAVHPVSLENPFQKSLNHLFTYSPSKISVTKGEIDIEFRELSSTYSGSETLENQKVLDFRYLIPFKDILPFGKDDIIPYFTDYNFEKALETYDKITLSKLSYIAFYCLEHDSFMYENLERFNEIPTLFIDFINIHKGHTQNSCELRQKTDSEMFKFVNFQGPITHKTKEPKQLSLQLIFKK